MKYFVNEKERKASGSTYYFEFQKGNYRNKPWLEDSLCLYADLFDKLGLFQLFSASLGTFDYFGQRTVLSNIGALQFAVYSRQKCKNMAYLFTRHAVFLQNHNQESDTIARNFPSGP